MEAERDLKENERMLEKIPSGRSMWSSTTSKYVCCIYCVILFNLCRDMVESTSAIVPTPLKV